jgi:hypothetical protein
LDTKGTFEIGGKWRQDPQHNDTQYKDTQHNDAQHKDTLLNDTQNNDSQHKDTQNNNSQNDDTQHKETKQAKLSVMTVGMTLLSITTSSIKTLATMALSV